MGPGDAAAHVRGLLSEVGISEAPLEAELLVAHALGTDRTHVHALPDAPIGPGTAGVLSRLLERRLRREPLAYILGTRWCYGLEFVVRPGALIPRPETELLIARAIALAQGTGQAVAIADAGTGSGNIAVAVAVHVPAARVFAIDISAQALAVARENAARHRVSERITFLEGDLLSPLPGPVDIVVANLPYVRRGALPTLQPELAYEPREALDGGEDGLDAVRRLLAQAPGKLKRGGGLLLELDPEQMEEAKSLALRAFPGAAVSIEKDLAGLDRMLEART